MPRRLWLVRHGESAGNVASREAVRLGAETISVSARDADVALSELGLAQARALGHWFATRPEEEQPTHVFSSPYLRASQPALAVIEAAGLVGVEPRLDERLRERELGVLNRLTRAGVSSCWPEEAELRRTLGKFYYRPPGGESWCDVILRLRSFLVTLAEEHADARVLVVSHSVLALCARYILEHLSEAELLAIDRASDIANCALTSYVASNVGLRLVDFNLVAPIAAEPITDEPDPPRAS